MNKPPPRRWFQLHLSTVIALTLTAGGLIGLNLRGRVGPMIDYETKQVTTFKELKAISEHATYGPVAAFQFTAYGFPLDCYRVKRFYLPDKGTDWWVTGDTYYFSGSFFQYAVNTSVGVAILVISALIMRVVNHRWKRVPRE